MSRRIWSPPRLFYPVELLKARTVCLGQSRLEQNLQMKELWLAATVVTVVFAAGVELFQNDQGTLTTATGQSDWLSMKRLLGQQLLIQGKQTQLSMFKGLSDVLQWSK